MSPGGLGATGTALTFILSFLLSFFHPFFLSPFHPFFLPLFHSFSLPSLLSSFLSLIHPFIYFILSFLLSFFLSLYLPSLFRTLTFAHFVLLISQLVHMKHLLALLLMTRMVLAECLTLSSAISTAVEQRNITATSTKITSKPLGSPHLFIEFFFTLLQSIF